MNSTIATYNEDWVDVFSHISPDALAFIGIASGLALSVVGAAWGIWTAAATLMGGCVKAPRIRSKNLISIIFCEANAIYGIIIAVILINKVSIGDYRLNPNYNYAGLYYAAYALFSAGISVGLSNVTSGLSVGICGSSCALSDAQNGALFAKMLISQIFASALGIYGIIIGIIVSNQGQFPN